MRALVQRVSSASVTIEGEVVGQIEQGLLVLLGVAASDSQQEVDLLADKLVNLRIFADAEGRSNLSLLDSGGAALVVSQFTLYADTRKGRRPSFIYAAPPEHAEPLVEAFVAALRSRAVHVQTGRFGAMMQVALVNDGPVTIMLDSDTLTQARRQ